MPVFGEIERIVEEAVMAYFKLHTWTRLQGLTITTKSLRIVGVGAQIGTARISLLHS
jgi:hypothetical protein